MSTTVTHNCDVCGIAMPRSMQTFVRISYPDYDNHSRRCDIDGYEPDFDDSTSLDTCITCTAKARQTCPIAIRNAIIAAIKNSANA